MPNAQNLADAFKFIALEAETPRIAVHMIATVIDGVTGWCDLPPLGVTTEAGDNLTKIDGVAVHLHDML